MPRAPMRCSPSCPKPVVAKGKCEDHQPVRIAWENSREREFLKSAAWDRQRKRIIFRDKGNCQLCGTSGARHVDHIIPTWYTKVEEVSDEELQLLCDKCHAAKSSFEGVQAKKIRKAEKDGIVRS